jgi:hypothetical protein
MERERRWLDVSALGGAVAAIASLAVDITSPIALPLVDRLVVLGPLVVAPLAVEAGLRPWPTAPLERRLAALIARTLPFAAGAALAATLLGTGPLAAVFATLWLIETLLIAALGLVRTLARGRSPLHELAIDVGHLYLPIGAVWFLASRLRIELMGFGHVIVLLTAAHFHFAGLAAPVIAGQVGRLIAPGSRWSVWYRRGAFFVVVAPILVALGITFSPILEVTMATLLALGILVVAVVTVLHVAPRGGAHYVLGAAQLVLLVTMALAVVYAVGELLGETFVFIRTMVAYHGALNAIGFAIPSLIALRFIAPHAASQSCDAPLLAVPGRGVHVGPKALDTQIAGPARGLLPSLAGMLRVEHPSADPHPDVAAFYEDTTALRLVCVPRWRPLFALPGRLFVRIARAMGQLVLPIEDRAHTIVSRLGALRDGPREGAVASVRTYEDGSAMYVSVYAEHEADGVRYMSIGMPLPFGWTLASVLRGTPREEGGLELTSVRARGHEGLWLHRGGLRIALPLDETLIAHAASTEAGRALAARVPCASERTTMVAWHRFTLFGVPCLELAYAIEPASKAVDESPAPTGDQAIA